MGQSIEEFVFDVRSNPTAYGVYNGDYSTLIKQVPEFKKWWLDTEASLKKIGISNPNPVEQFELIEANSEGLIVINNNVECI